MDGRPPRTAEQWRTYLTRHSAEFLASDYLRKADADYRRVIDDDQRRSGWLGYAPASEDAIRAAEARLGVRLPPSYRDFLLVSDGWSHLNYNLNLKPVAEIGWFADLEPGHLDAFEPILTDEENTFLQRFLQRCLLISADDGGAGGRWFLHADDAADSGEFRAYEWWPDGAFFTDCPYPDFAALVTGAD